MWMIGTLLKVYTKRFTLNFWNLSNLSLASPAELLKSEQPVTCVEAELLKSEQPVTRFAAELLKNEQPVYS